MSRIGILLAGSVLCAGLLGGAWLLHRATLVQDRVVYGHQLLADLPPWTLPAAAESRRRAARLAIALFDRALRDAPGHADALRGRARARLALGEFDAAASDLDALAARPDASVQDLATLGSLDARAGRDAQALARLEAAAAALEPGDESATLALAWLRITAADPAIRDPAKGWQSLLTSRHLLPSRDDPKVRPAARLWLLCFPEPDPSFLARRVEQAARRAVERGELTQADYEQAVLMVGEGW